jgi:hypothetical protein
MSKALDIPSHRAFAVLAVAAPLAACWSALQLGFVSDDFLILARLDRFDGLRNPLAYFGLRHFDYYRPLAFLSFALDRSLWANRAIGYHLTSLALHALNALLVFSLARRMMGAWPALVAAVLFAVHPSHHEAVYWLSARFDLLAASCFLVGLLALGRSGIRNDLAAAGAFLAAILSKESAIAFPVVAVGFTVLVQQASPARVFRQLSCFATVGVLYVWMRHAAGLAAAGGWSRVPKLAVMAALVAIAVHAARKGWPHVAAQLRASRLQVSTAFIVAAALAGVVAMSETVGAPFRLVLNAVGFAAAHLASPIGLDALVGNLPGWFWLAGWVALGAVAVLASAAWPMLTGRPEPPFLLLFLTAALVPVSSMTEGTRYLYLASVPAALLAGLAAEGVPRRWAPAFAVAVGAAIAVGGWDLHQRAADWRWAAAMTEEAAAAISAGLGARCDGRSVVLVTAPTRPRGVYANVNIESLQRLQACSPERVYTLIREGHDSAEVDAAWKGANELVLHVSSYRGGFTASRDLRTFDVPIDRATPTLLSNGFGTIEAWPRAGGLDVRIAVGPAAAVSESAWFVFGHSGLRWLPRPPGSP